VDGLDGVVPVIARRRESELTLQRVEERARWLRPDPYSPVALDVGVSAHRAQTRAALPDVAADQRDVDDLLDHRDPVAVLGHYRIPGFRDDDWLEGSLCRVMNGAGVGLGGYPSTLSGSNAGNRRLSPDLAVDPVAYARVMELGATHVILLWLVAEIEATGVPPGTRVLGQRLSETLGQRPSQRNSAPWHGTDPFVRELRESNLLKVRVAKARFPDWTEAYTVEEYGSAQT
jgi:hypothetical protein